MTMMYRYIITEIEIYQIVLIKHKCFVEHNKFDIE